MSENTTLRHARELIKKIKIAQKSDKSSESMSVRSHDSRRSHASHASTSSSVARLRAAAEAAAAKEQAEYERLIAEKENEMKQREAEEEKRRQQECAQHERDIAVMSANKRVGVANARLKAIQESILKEEINDPLELPIYRHYGLSRKEKGLGPFQYPQSGRHAAFKGPSHTHRWTHLRESIRP